MKLSHSITRLAVGLVLVGAACVGCKSTRAPSGSGSASTPPPTPRGKTLVLPKIEPDPREALIAPLIVGIVQQQHLLAKPLDNNMSSKAFDRYLKSLDPLKLFFLADHVRFLEGYRLKMDDEIKAGDLTLAHKATALMRQRIAVLGKYVAERLKKPFDFTRDESLETEPKKRAWAKDEAALRERWRKTLKLSVLQRVLRMEKSLASLEKAKKKAKAKSGSGKGTGTGSGSGSGSGDDALQALEKAAKKIPKTEKARSEKARKDIAKRWSGRFARLAAPDPLDGPSTFINALLHEYDPHTGYLPPATKENFDIRMSGSLEGIGAVLQEDDHYIRVVRIVPGGASWRQGELEAGDLILAVAQEGKDPVDVVDARIDKVVRMIRGPKGTVVTLTVKKPDERVKLISIVRDVIKIEQAYARGAVIQAKGGGEKIGYIDLPSFYGNTRSRRGLTPKRRCSTDVRKLLTRFAKRKVAGVIIDLRGNGGGLLDDARAITGLFIESGPVVQTHGRTGGVDVLRDDDGQVVYDGQVIVLVDRSSASASEIVAGALQDYGRAVIVGTGATHGKGTVQVLASLDRLARRMRPPSLGVLKLTRYQFFRINGDSTQLRGVVPDVRLVDPVAYIKGGERRLENALAFGRVKAVPFKRWSKKTSWSVQALQTQSAARQAKTDVFKKLEARNKLLTARREQSVVPLSAKKWRAWIDQRQKELDAVSPDVSKGPARLSVTPVIYAKTTVVRPRPGSKKKSAPRSERWSKNLERDPWVAEAAAVLGDMRTSGKK
ncbi:MAG: carboxy terminal-processing peptidase [Myxococcales bacterium]|nr:carboxy terminal-processing peptidase [Myxococcales bacterium]